MRPDSADFSHLTDEELVKTSQSGNEKAEALIFERYKGDVTVAAKSYFLKFSGYCLQGLLDYDDIHQEALLGLLSAIYSFREDKKVTFRTYASKCISNAIKAAIKSATSKKNSPAVNKVPLDEIEIPSPVTVEDSLIDDENEENLNTFLHTELSSLEYSVLRLFLSELSYKSIAESLGVSEKSVDNAIQRIRGKINRFLNNNRS